MQHGTHILHSTCTQTEMDLADQHHFLLSAKDWEAFLKALDDPPRYRLDWSGFSPGAQ